MRFIRADLLSLEEEVEDREGSAFQQTYYYPTGRKTRGSGLRRIHAVKPHSAFIKKEGDYPTEGREDRGQGGWGSTSERSPGGKWKRGEWRT